MQMYSFVTWLERFIVACKIYVGMVWKHCGVISICVCMAHFWGFHPYIHTSKMIYHWRGEPERACITDAMFCHGIQTMDNSRTVCCSMSMVSKTLCSHFSGQGSYTLGLNFTISHELNLWHLWVSLCMALTWSELNYCAWFDGTVCEQPALVCHGSQSHSSARWGPLACSSTCTKLYPFIQFKYSVYGWSYRQTYTRVLQCSHASVGLTQARPN